MGVSSVYVWNSNVHSFCWVVYWLVRVWNSIMLHSSRGRLIPYSRLELDVPLGGWAAESSVPFLGSISHLSKLWAAHFPCQTDYWSNPVGQVLNSYIYSWSSNKNACISGGLRYAVVICLGKSHGAADLLIKTRQEKNYPSSPEAGFVILASEGMRWCSTMCSAVLYADWPRLILVQKHCRAFWGWWF